MGDEDGYSIKSEFGETKLVDNARKCVDTFVKVEDDEVVEEIDLVLSQCHPNEFYLVQYPLRPPWRRYEDSNIKEVRYKKGQQIFEISFKCNEVELAGQKQRDEYVRKISEELENFSMDQDVSSGLQEDYTISSTIVPLKSNYMMGVYREKCLYVTPIKGVIQFRPSFKSIDDTLEVNKKKVEELLNLEEDLSEAKEQALDSKPLQFLIKKKESEKSAEIRMKSYSHLKQLEMSEEFQVLQYVNKDRWDSIKIINQIFRHENQRHSYYDNVSKEEYLKLINLCNTSENENIDNNQLLEKDANATDTSKSNTINNSSDMQQSTAKKSIESIKVVSMHLIRTQEISKQICLIMQNAQIMSFDMMLSYVNCPEEQLIKVLPECAVLVKGVWILRSHYNYNDKIGATRDYVLMKFALHPNPETFYFTRAALMDLAKITSEQAESVLEPICDLYKGYGWKLKCHIPDISFIQRYPELNKKFEMWWMETQYRIGQ